MHCDQMDFVATPAVQVANQPSNRNEQTTPLPLRYLPASEFVRILADLNNRAVGGRWPQDGRSEDSCSRHPHLYFAAKCRFKRLRKRAKRRILLRFDTHFTKLDRAEDHQF